MSRYICTECTSCYEADGDCPRCEGEPLLDLQDEDVVLMLQEQDDRTARTRHYAIAMTFSIIGFVIGIVGSMAIAGFSHDIGINIFSPAIVPLAIGAAIGEGVYRMFPAKRILPAGA